MDYTDQNAPVRLATAKHPTLCKGRRSGINHGGNCFAGDLVLYAQFESSGRYLVQNREGNLMGADPEELIWLAEAFEDDEDVCRSYA